ncbi:hypothetical protein AKJ16_DCAP09403, partial [Drosera capensis]
MVDLRQNSGCFQSIPATLGFFSRFRCSSGNLGLIRINGKIDIKEENIETDIYGVHQLEEVKIFTNRVRCNLLQFAIYLLKNCVSLRKPFFIKDYTTVESRSWDKAERRGYQFCKNSEGIN